MLKVVFLDHSTLPAGSVFPKLTFEHQWDEYATTSAEQVLARAENAEIIITNKVQLTREIMQQLPKLKLIAIVATGTNNVDLQAAAELGIQVNNVTGYADVTVPEHTIAMIFALKRNLMGWYRDQLTEKWADSKSFCYFDYPISDVKDSTIGIVGKGNLGISVGKLAEALGMRVLFAERKGAAICRPGYLPFEQVIQESDIVTLHSPLTEDNKNLINRETLKLFKKTAILINTARGAQVDEVALCEALEAGDLAGAGLDVMVSEPPTHDNVLLQAATRLPNLIITPHIAWSSDSAIKRLLGQAADKINKFVSELN